MFHLYANFVAIANVANTEVPALADQVFTPRNNRLVPPEDLFIHAIHSTAVTLLRSRINTPYMRKYAPSFINPIGTTLLPPTDPNMMDLRDNPLRLPKDEGLVYESTDSAAGPNNHYILTWLAKQLMPSPRGDIVTIRGTSTTAAVASAWTTVTVTWDTDVAGGWYEVIGGSYIATNAVAFRCLFEGQTYRPGGLGGAAAGVRPWLGQLKGGMGVWGRFRATMMPGLEVLNDGTDNAHTFLLDCVKVP